MRAFLHENWKLDVSLNNQGACPLSYLHRDTN